MEVTFDDKGLVTGIVQDTTSREVLMVAYLNAEALEATLRTGQAHFWSRSRQELWHKGATSGNNLAVRRISPDCDGDALLIEVDPAGPACHSGAETCFGSPGGARQGFATLESLWDTICERALTRPEGSYTARLLEEGSDGPARKVMEEAGEVAFAAKDHATGQGGADRIAEEAADLVFHLLVLLRERGVEPAEVLDVLRERAG